MSALLQYLRAAGSSTVPTLADMEESQVAGSVYEALIAQHPHVGRGQAIALTMEGLVLVNGRPARHPDQYVRTGDEITIDGLPALLP
ncbi:hypothetical protein [Nocardia rhamnosiphila]